MIRTAIRSAKNSTTLEPCFVYDGSDDGFIEEFREYGVKIIFHRVSFYDQLLARAKTSLGYLNICSGAFLRVEIPLLETKDDYVLYTDCDVIFLSTTWALSV